MRVLIMKTSAIAATTLLITACVAVVVILVAGCGGLHRPASISSSRSGQVGSANVSLARELPAPSSEISPAVIRVGGDTEVTTQYHEGAYHSGSGRVPTPLPEGYPEPTPPGAIDLKRYPQVRRAGISGSVTPDWGMNFAFFPLFNHIKRRDIAMTSPVELNYEGLDEEASHKPRGWTMSFLYRDVNMGPTGIDPGDERILIEDVPPMIVVSVGMQGPYKLSLVNKGLAELRGWLASQSEWEAAGEPRALFYNGPEASARVKWSEIQIPVQRQSYSEHGH